MESQFFIIREYIGTLDDFILFLLLFVVLNGIAIWAFHSWIKLVLNLRQKNFKNAVFYFLLFFILGAMSLPMYSFVFPPWLCIALTLGCLVLVTRRGLGYPSLLPIIDRIASANPVKRPLDSYSYAPLVLPKPLPKEVIPATELLALEKKANTLWKHYQSKNESDFWRKYEQLLKQVKR